MKINEEFVKEILQAEYPDSYQQIYDSSLLLQYLDQKMKAVHGGSKARRSLANIYAIYSILHFYQADFYNRPDEYRNFGGYDYSKLRQWYSALYGGSKLQNHALNNRAGGEFRNKFSTNANDLLISNNGKYLIHIDYLYVGTTDISQAAIKVIETYIDLLIAKDRALLLILREMQASTDYAEKKDKSLHC